MKKEEFIRIRVAGWQKKYISLQAEKAHKSLSQYVRDAAMDKEAICCERGIRNRP